MKNLKTTTLISFFVFLMVSSVYSQNQEKLELGLFVNAGFVPTELTYHTFRFQQTIRSISTGEILDLYDRTVSVNEKLLYPTLDFDVEFRYMGLLITSSLAWNMDFKSAMAGFNIELGVGYVVHLSDRFNLVPKLSYAWADARVDLCEIPLDNYSTLRVNETVFCSDDVNVWLIMPERLLKPSIHIDYLTKSNFTFRFTAGYGASIKSFKNNVSFSGEDKYGDTHFEKREITKTENSDTVTCNGEILDGKISSQKGLFLGVGIGLVLK